MDKLYELLIKLFFIELNKLKIGYEFNPDIIDKMVDICHAIDYIRNNDITNKEFFKIINYYGN